MKNPFTSSPKDPSPSPEETPLQRFMKDFNARYKTEKDFVEALCPGILGEGGAQCKKCGSNNIERDYGDRIGECKDCGNTFRLTAGTFFNRIRSARPYLLAILLLESGIVFNASDLARGAEIVNSSAQIILKKITMVIHDRMENDPSVESISSARFYRTFCKRSLETPAKEHPIAEQDEMEKRQSEPDADGSGQSSADPSSDETANETTDANNAPELSEAEKVVLQELSAAPINVDALAKKLSMAPASVLSSLTVLELYGLAECLPGNRYIRSAAPAMGTKEGVDSHESEADCEMNVDVFIDFIRSGFHGISRKYLQLYLGAYWCFFDKVKWPSGSLLNACRLFRRVSRDDLRAFVTPLSVKVVPFY